ncbi:MAG: class B sortase [Oscillospiraceae bacterium]|nr:class B sortase [Oscillospiraceae bacterium]
MHKYQGKYLTPRPKRRPFLYLGLGCAVLALLAAAYVGLFFWTGAQRKQASRQTAMEYVTPVTLPTAPTPKETEATQTTEVPETTVPETTAETQPPRFPTVDFAGLREKNPDVVAWIQIPALEGVDYPVVMGEDNAYYVNRNWEKAESEEGAIFLDFRNRSDFSQPHNILYGHCMKDGTMFQPLGQWEKESFLTGNDRTVLLYLPDEVRVYEIIGSERVNALDSRVYKTDYTAGQSWADAIGETLKNLWYDLDTQYDGNSEILTLSTCMGGDQRLTVHAICVEHVPNGT